MWDRFSAPPAPPAPPPLRLVLLGVAVISVVTGGSILFDITTRVWALDIDRNLRAAHELLASRFGTDRGYLYSPLAALLTVPLAALPYLLSVWIWLVARLAVIAWGVRNQTRGLDKVDVLLVGIAVVAFLPTGYDLLLGNVTALVVAAIALVAWRRDGFSSGVALGVILATAPKPQLIPVLLWMLAYRPRALGGALGTAAMATLLTVGLLGLGPYLMWLDVLRAPDYLSSPMNGNLTPDALMPAFAWPIKIAALGGLVFALRRGETNGLIAALAVGLLIAPYTIAYAAMILVLGVRPVASAAPRLALGLAAIGSIAVFVALPLYALAWLVAACALKLAPVDTSLRPSIVTAEAEDDPRTAESASITVASTG